AAPSPASRCTPTLDAGDQTMPTEAPHANFRPPTNGSEVPPCPRCPLLVDLIHRRQVQPWVNTSTNRVVQSKPQTQSSTSCSPNATTLPCTHGSFRTSRF